MHILDANFYANIDYKLDWKDWPGKCSDPMDSSSHLWPSHPPLQSCDHTSGAWQVVYL